MTDSSLQKKIAVIGGGASGLVAAITAARLSARVFVYEMKDTPGKKINGTGNGKCNLTNEKMGIEFFRGENPVFASDALAYFGVSETLAFFNEIGVAPKSKNGYYYPNSEEASSVSECLFLECKALGVGFVFEEVKNIVPKQSGFLVNSEKFDRVIICCGSFANMKNAGSFNGYELCKNLGHSVTSLFPALTQIRCDGKFFKTINGVRLEAGVSVRSDDKEIDFEKGEILFTEYGVSGIPAFQSSRFCNTELSKNRTVELILDFFIDKTEDELLSDLKKRSKKNRTAEEFFYGLLNHKLNFVILNMLNINPTGSAEKLLTESVLKAYSQAVKKFTCRVNGTNGFENSQVVAGGVKTSEIDSKTMESKIVPGLFFAGEIIDVDGTCGGYNLQWAWSSGKLAGESATR